MGPPEVADKHGVLRAATDLKLDLGCGERKRGEEYLGVDVLDSPAVDLLGEATEALGRLPAGSVACIFASHFLEHVDDLDGLLSEMARVVKPGGEVEIVVPHFSNPYFYSDPTHRRTFGLYSFSYFVARAPLKRQVPRYGRDLPFRLARVSLGFKSTPPFYGRHFFKRLFGLIFNSSRGLREFYEENLCYLVPCYEVRFVLVRA